MMITVNGRKYGMADHKTHVSYSDVLLLANIRGKATVTVYVPGSGRRGETLSPGERVLLQPEMVINAALTGAA